MSKRKAPDQNNLNYDLCDILIELGNNERNINKNIYKYNAYRKAASALSKHPTRIKSGEEARKLDGIGEKIAKKIDEILKTGKLQKLENIKQDDKSQSINLLTRVSGIGPAKAQALFEKGITSIEDLRKHEEELNHHQKIGLKYFEDFEKKIPRSEILEIEELIKDGLEKLDTSYQYTICGSFRRGKSESGDIDILLTHPFYTSTSHGKEDKFFFLQNVVDILKKNDLITETISMGHTKFMGTCRLTSVATTRRLDIRLTPCDEYYCSVLYYTGSDIFNQQMRQHAREQGFTLNEYSLRKLGVTGVPGSPIPISSEKEIFEYIDYPYKEPEERD